jgi:ribosome biogenesis GTPase / thiamine phosphate phosphatase
VSSRHDIEDPAHYERPRRHTRPRTKLRPTHDEAVNGLVVTVDRGRYTVQLEHADSAQGAALVTAMKSRPLGRRGVVVGDRVRVVGDVSGAEGALARIVDVEPRATALRRTADDTDPVERVVVANATQLVVVTAVKDPEPRPRLIDRALVAAYDAGLQPVLCITKPDLADASTLLDIYRPLQVPYVVVRALVPGAARVTGSVNEVTGRGRHTSTSVYALALPFGGWVIDTPGIRSFGLAHVEPATLIAAFDDLDALTATCPRGCTHGFAEPECALDEAVADGRADAQRVDSFRRLLESLSQ